MPAEAGNSPQDRQRLLNQQSAANTLYFASHRKRIMDLVLQMPRRTKDRLMVLGAGNVNDLELPALCRVFEAVHLVDIDGEALGRAEIKAGPHRPGGLLLHPGVNLLDPLVAEQLPAEMDTVLSTCVLSQLIDALHLPEDATGEQVSLVLDTRKEHIQLMLGLLKEGGTGLLVTDMVSSDTVGDLSKAGPMSWRLLMDRLIEERNFFTGLNPHAVMQVLYMDRDISPQVEQVHFHGPWKWDLSPERCYLVYAVSFQKKAP